MLKLGKLNIGERLRNYVRVLKIAKKPSIGEFVETFKICLAGLAIVGLVGFVVYLFSILFLG